MKRILVLITTLFVFSAVSSFLSAEPVKNSGGQMSVKEQTKTQKVCAVCGAPIDKDFYSDNDGKRVYFCGIKCKEAFDKNPEKYMKKAESEGVVFEKASEKKKGKPQTICPVKWGNPVNKNIFTDYKGNRIYFCCKGCPDTFKKDPDMYIKKLENAGIELEASPVKEGKPQTICPVMWGNPINKKIYTDYKGKRIYFCCNMCPDEFKKDPEKYMKKLTDEGYILEDAPKEEKGKDDKK